MKTKKELKTKIVEVDSLEYYPTPYKKAYLLYVKITSKINNKIIEFDRILYNKEDVKKFINKFLKELENAEKSEENKKKAKA